MTHTNYYNIYYDNKISAEVRNSDLQKILDQIIADLKKKKKKEAQELILLRKLVQSSQPNLF